jgi:hypothetical protein
MDGHQKGSEKKLWVVQGEEGKQEELIYMMRRNATDRRIFVFTRIRETLRAVKKFALTR